ncbi:PTS system IIA component, Gat family [Thermoanaerobacter sp. YS13]|uniref:PTS sugar transporter subunit IIA n=1 Tax=Thermoanaerobacter sp. YS13 TaxID=1511746 RepID=UPI0005749E3D|nr:PTS sugar transporter subunit IIA [Thermoanaerobacter sp. YS13]KHO61418.1 PTS system IIA component, Gat family [Thermoanaerobacter sp. YS13]
MDVLIFTEEVEGNREEVLSHIAEILLEKGFVKKGYKESLLEREKYFPTGLYVDEELKVAIPHTEVNFANKNVLVVVKPLNSVHFYRMDKPDVEIEVDIIFALVIKDSHEYLKFLSKLTENLTNEEFVKLIKTGNLENISAYIKNFISV